MTTWGSGRLALAFVVFAFAAPTAAAGSDPTVGGKYSGLLSSFECKRDQAKYGRFGEHGYWKALSWCGRSVPAGYWVWVAPRWYVYKHKRTTTLSARKRASVGGKYRDLIMTLRVPADVASYGRFHDHSYYPATRYAGRSVPAGHWVYVAPVWYVWRTKDLRAAGLDLLKRTVRFSKRTVTFRFEYKQAHRRWANNMLTALIRGVREVERWSGVPFPGSNPYRIYEGTSKGLLGFASAKSMYLSGPARSGTWTLMHEMLHIWNAGAGPMWVGEGQANFVSFWLMRRLKMPFQKGNTLYSWIASWKRHQHTARDLPMYENNTDNYKRVRQGKAMELWSILYQRYGPSFLRWVFIQTTQRKHVSLTAIKTYLRRYHHERHPDRLFSGWVTRGQYHYRSHKLPHPKHRLP